MKKKRWLFLPLCSALVLTMVPVTALAEINTDRVQLAADVIWEGAGTEESPYEIPDLPTLEAFREYINMGDGAGTYFKLTADIDMSGTYNADSASWTPIGSEAKPFTGHFDGNGYRITGLYVIGTSRGQGLFGYIGSGGTVKNLGVDGMVEGNQYVGGVVGNNEGTVEACYNTGAVTGSTQVGGIAGRNTGRVESCYNIGTVNCSGDHAGGVVGGNFGTNKNCYYLDSCGASGGGTSKTAEGFVSGEVAWLLQTEQTELIWGQTVASAAAQKDSFPVTTSDSAKAVYRVIFAAGASTNYAVKYANPAGVSDMPDPPQAEKDYAFSNWTLDGEEFTAYTPVAKDITVSAQWMNTSIYTVSYLDAGGNSQTAEAAALTAADTAWAEGWYVASGEITLDNSVRISGEVHLVLADGCALTVNGGIGGSGSFTVYAQSAGENMGKLVVQNVARNFSGIGDSECEAITINGGNVSVTGGDNAAAIGSGNRGSCGTITINGGKVSATGGLRAAGIGSGWYGSCGTIMINGGEVSVTGGNYGAGIGSGYYGSCGTVTINEGEVSVTGGNYGAGIGSGYYGSSGDFSTGENGGAVIFANGGDWVAAISDTSDKENWSGVIFENADGRVHGASVTFDGNLMIGESQNLTISEDCTLINSGTIVNNGTVAVKGTLINNGSIINNGIMLNSGVIQGNVMGNQPEQAIVSARYLNYENGNWIEKEAVCNRIKETNTAWAEGWYVASGEITLDNSVRISGEVHLVLADGCVLTVNGGIGGSGSFTVYAQSTGENMGKLVVQNVAQNFSGIGDSECEAITINGGNVSVTGGANAAAIGSGWYGSCGTITINGGKVSAAGGRYAAGIGSGNRGSCGTITINGGKVSAAGGWYATGIGSGYYGSSGDFSTGENGGAVIFANGGDWAAAISDTSDKENWSGVIFENADGRVYGALVAPALDFTIDSGKSLWIPNGSTLDVGDISLVNDGNIYVDGSLQETGRLSGSGNQYYLLTVTGGVPAGSVSEYGGRIYGAADGEITLTENGITPVGQAVLWQTSDSSVTIDDNCFKMPAGALTVTAAYRNAPAYTITIPATVSVGEEAAEIKAEDVNVAAGYHLTVRLTAAGDENFLLRTDEGAELAYAVKKDGNLVAVNDTVLTVPGGTADSSGTASLAFGLAENEAVKYAGVYKDTVTFTVSVQKIPVDEP